MRVLLVLTVCALSACSGSSTPASSTRAESAERTTAPVEVVVETVREDETAGPQTAVRVHVTTPSGRQTVDLGVLANCTRADTTAGSLASVRCWWAGAGDAIEIVERDGAIVVTRQEADEGSEEPFPVVERGRVPLEGARPVLSP